ncbi:hypothetical protein QOT17_022442 [Balamuthia mandrillaris]
MKAEGKMMAVIKIGFVLEHYPPVPKINELIEQLIDEIIAQIEKPYADVVIHAIEMAKQRQKPPPDARNPEKMSEYKIDPRVDLLSLPNEIKVMISDYVSHMEALDDHKAKMKDTFTRIHIWEFAGKRIKDVISYDDVGIYVSFDHEQDYFEEYRK